MATVDVFNTEKKKVGTLDLRDDVFAAPVNVALVHQVIKAQLAGRRQGTAKTKTKAEVRGGGKKPYKQKGTGNARQGSTRSSQFVGGGQNFGPTPRSYDQRTPKKMLQGAIRSALSDRVKSERFLVLESLHLDAPKTRVLSQIVRKNLGLNRVLVVDQENPALQLSGRNIAGVQILPSEGLNVYDIVRNEWLVMTRAAVKAVEERFPVLKVKKEK